MNRDRALELLPVIEAFARGEAIEFQVLGGGLWYSCDCPTFSESHEYRIKPKAPRVRVMLGVSYVDPSVYYSVKLGSRIVRGEFVGKFDGRSPLLGSADSYYWREIGTVEQGEPVRLINADPHFSLKLELESN